jgi:hypothetical protein
MEEIMMPQWQVRNKRKGDIKGLGESGMSCRREEITHLLSLEEVRQ